MTKSQQGMQDKKRTKPPDPFKISKHVPQWMKVIEKPLVKESDVKLAPGYPGTIEIFSQINGWITVTPDNKNRSKRLGRYGPFEKAKKRVDFQKESDLAPH